MNRIHSVDYLRGLASLAVTWFHLTNTYSEDSWVRHSGAYGWLGIEVFFVISGFVIPYSIARSFSNYQWKDFSAFMAKRMIRIELPYVTSILMVIVLAFLSSMSPGFRGDPPVYGFVQVFSHLFYLTPLVGEKWVQPVYWTLAYEFVFYICIGLLFPLILRFGGWVVWMIILLLGVLTALDAMSARIWLFVFGFLLYLYFYQDGTYIGGRNISLMALAAFLFMACKGDPLGVGMGILTIFLLRSLLWIKVPQAVDSQLMKLGGISYSLYLVHIPVGGKIVNFGRRFFSDDLGLIVLSLSALACSILAAWIFWRYVERPSIRLARNWAYRKRAQVRTSA